MNKLIARLKGIQIDRILTVFLVGLLLFVSTACSGGASAKTADNVRKEVPGSAVTNQYKGGMNDYSDVDPRQDIKSAQTKAKALVDNAQKNIDQKSVDSPEQYVENYRSGTPLGERVRRIGEDVGKAAENVKEEASRGAQKNLQNAQDAGQDVANKADKAGNAVQSKVKSDIRSTQRTLDKAADAVD
ncbi:MAG TPA: hypothetical protein DCE56_25030 [Cyanobacteria bacterium UBA8553]|nr:hypothetical protein [Cyanobacteria bacterium UBA8553]